MFPKEKKEKGVCDVFISITDCVRLKTAAVSAVVDISVGIIGGQ
jgi:hypothetical protein